MPDIPQNNAAAKDDPVPLRTKVFSSFKGVYTRAARTAIPDDYFYNLEGAIPIGEQNLHVVPNISAGLHNYSSDFIYWSQSVNQNGVEYLVNFATNGKVFLYNIGSGTSTQINVGHILSGAGSQCDQWKNTVILFIDSTGYYSYDGANFNLISGTGVPTSGDSIAVYANYVWIVQGRLLYTSGINDYTAPAWQASAGAQITNLTDPQIRNKVRRLKAQNGYLYLIADTSINAISDVYIPAGASPPTPLFSNQNIQSLIGTDQPASIFAYDRLMMFASRYGAHTLYGVSAPKVSGDIDGTWQFIDFSQTISGGQVVVANILCGAFLIKRSSQPNYLEPQNDTVIALWFQTTDTSPQTGVTDTSDIWWFTDYGALTFIVSGIKNNVPTLFGFKDNVLYQMFADSSTAPSVNIQSKLWPMEDQLQRKEAVTAGVEAFFSIFGSSFALYLDTESGNTPLTVNVQPQSGQWFSSLLNIQGNWKNTLGITGGWVAPSLILMPADAKGGFSRHVGLTVNSVGYAYELHLMALDYKLRDRWL